MCNHIQIIRKLWQHREDFKIAFISFYLFRNRKDYLSLAFLFHFGTNYRIHEDKLLDSS